ncbi:hypothetical protein VS868_09775 [Salinimicrobium sp. 3283s]|uniref:hypothetical protein n=1 Tax=Salinimicrobium sp. 3283s TaxID=3114359 RepID=UPI0031EF01BA
MKFWLVLCLFIAPSLLLTAQNINLPTEYIRNTIGGEKTLPVNIQGSPYPTEEFQHGTVNILDKSFTTLVRYNALSDAFEIKDPTGEITTLLRRPDITVELNGSDYEIEYFIDDDGNRRQGYFQKFNDGDAVFLKRRGVIKQDAVKATSSYGRDKPASLDHYEKYFLKNGDSPAEEVRLKRKDILRQLNNEEVEQFVKKHKFKLKKESEVIQTLEYYNSLNKE